MIFISSKAYGGTLIIDFFIDIKDFFVDVKDDTVDSITYFKEEAFESIV